LRNKGKKEFGTYRSCLKQASRTTFDPSYFEQKSENLAKIKHTEDISQEGTQKQSVVQLE
jgi:hypothetical protein